MTITLYLRYQTHYASADFNIVIESQYFIPETVDVNASTVVWISGTSV